MRSEALNTSALRRSLSARCLSSRSRRSSASFAFFASISALRFSDMVEAETRLIVPGPPRNVLVKLGWWRLSQAGLGREYLIETSPLVAGKAGRWEALGFVSSLNLRSDSSSVPQSPL